MLNPISISTKNKVKEQYTQIPGDPKTFFYRYRIIDNMQHPLKQLNIFELHENVTHYAICV